MADDVQLRDHTAAFLSSQKGALTKKYSLLGFDGFVDEIVRVVDKRESSKEYLPIKNIPSLAQRISQAAGKGTNIELVPQQTKIGGNGPIMANALASFDISINYIGTLGSPNIHNVFREFSSQANVISIAEPGYTDALEFDDGKIMLGKLSSLYSLSWKSLIQKIGFENLLDLFQKSDLIGLVNWTMTTHMSEIWQNILNEICPQLPQSSKKQTIFFDLADPEKRFTDDIKEALQLIAKFAQYFHVILGLNEKESNIIADVMNIPIDTNSPEAIQVTADKIRQQLNIGTVIIHPRAYAVAAMSDAQACVTGPFASKPLISTGGGDHFNAGFCMGHLLELPLDGCLLTGVATSGFYVRTGKSPTLDELIDFIKNWPSVDHK